MGLVICMHVLILTSPLGRMQSVVMNVSVCVCVPLSAHLKSLSRNLLNFLCMLTVAMTRWSLQPPPIGPVVTVGKTSGPRSCPSSQFSFVLLVRCELYTVKISLYW